MNKKPDQPNIYLWSAIIGVIGVIVGAAFGYFGAQESAQAQIETAKINIYGPIYTTQTAEAKATPAIPSAASASTTSSQTSIPKSEILQLEQINQEILTFAGDDDNNGGTAELDISYDSEFVPKYNFIYNVPNDIFGYAGLAFKFHKGIDVSDYKSIEFTIEFRQTNASIDLYLADIANVKSFTRIVSTGDEKMNVSFPLTNFAAVDLNALKEIDFYTEKGTNSEVHIIIVSDFRFVK